MNDGCIIPLNGWTEGRKEFQVSVGKEFFEAFDNSEILDANVRIDISVEKSLRVTDVDLELSARERMRRKMDGKPSLQILRFRTLT